MFSHVLLDLGSGSVVVDLTHGSEAILHRLVDIARPHVHWRMAALLNDMRPAAKRKKCGAALNLGHRGRKTRCGSYLRGCASVCAGIGEEDSRACAWQNGGERLQCMRLDEVGEGMEG